MSTTVVTFKKPLASSHHVTWWIKGAKILDILPRSGQYVLAFFIWRWIRIKRKVTMPRVAEYLVGMCSFEYRINWRIRYVSYSDIAYLTGHSILSIRTILSYTRGQTPPASGSHVTYRISSPNMI